MCRMLGHICKKMTPGWRKTSRGWRSYGENINCLEEEIEGFAGVNYAVGLSCGTAARHLAVKLAAEKPYGSSSLCTSVGDAKETPFHSWWSR